MRFSKWHALGNAYLLVERADLAEPLLDRGRAPAVRPARGVGADGVLEIVEIRGAEADDRRLEPGRVARGAVRERRAYRGDVARAAERRRVSARRRVGERTVPARVEDDDVEVDLGAVEVGRPEALEVDGERLEFTPVSVGNPHAVIRREPSRDELLRLGPLVETHERFPDRTNVQLVRADGPNDLTVAGLGARGGGDAGVRVERCGGGGRGRRARLVREPGARAPSRGARWPWTFGRDGRS